MGVKRKSVSDPTYPVNIEFRTSNERDRFNEICREEGMTQLRLLLMLMDLYDNRPAPVPDNSEKITIPIYIRSNSNTTKTYINAFRGKLEYSSGWSAYQRLDPILAKKLENDFGFDVNVMDYECYDYSHSICLYYDADRHSYWVHEGIWVQANQEWYCTYSDFAKRGFVAEKSLEVSRCKLVKNFEETYAIFSRYTSPDEFTGLCQVLGIVLGVDIEDDISIMDKFFDGSISLRNVE